jgi:hypothetical protein
VVVLIEALNIVTVEAFVVDLQPDSQHLHRRKVLDREMASAALAKRRYTSGWREPPLRFVMNSSAGEA